jgi:hypothetical protein
MDFDAAKRLIVEEIKSSISNTIEQAITQSRSVIQARTPVDTGHLRNSWRGRYTTYKGTLRNTAYYAEYVEYGTKRSRAQPMLEPLIPVIEAELARSVSTGKPFNLGSVGYQDPNDALRETYREQYGNYGSQRGYSG